MILIHAGMHKTGSSSIQSTLAKLNETQIDYLPWRVDNHSGLFTLMFHDAPETTGGFKRAGSSAQSVRELADRWGARATALMEKRAAAGNQRPLVFSAEAISSAPEDAVQRMADYMRRYDPDIRVLAYVRPPISFMSSAFQQRSKFGLPHNLAEMRVWPRYRARFEKLDRVFGREAVTLKLFQRDLFAGGDVVLDFAREAGVTLDPSDVVRANESMSLEAIALLYVQSQYGARFGPRDQANKQRHGRFLDRVTRIGGRRFVLDGALTMPIVEANRADLDWMEARLGQPLLDAPAEGTDTVATEADLIAAAVAATPQLEQAITDTLATPVPDQTPEQAQACTVARRVDLLKEAMRLAEATRPAEATPADEAPSADDL